MPPVTQPKVDQIVYQPYSPERLGRIKAVLADGFVTVEWVTGQEQMVRARDLSYIDDLIADHEKKLSGHKARRAAAVEKWKI